MYSCSLITEFSCFFFFNKQYLLLSLKRLPTKIMKSAVRNLYENKTSLLPTKSVNNANLRTKHVSKFDLVIHLYPQPNILFQH